MFRKMPFILLAMIIAITLLDSVMPLPMKSFCYALSLTSKSLIICILPFIIFSLLFKTTVQLSSNATKMIAIILIAVCGSNFISTFLSHYVGMWVYHFDLSVMLPSSSTELDPLWSFTFPKLLSNDKAMLAGLILGICTTYYKPHVASKIAGFLDNMVNYTLHVLTYIIPVFVAGFVIKLNFDGGIKTIVHHYALIFLVIVIAQFSYIMLIYLLTNQLRFARFFHSLKNMLPAAIAGFSTMSSAAAMPLTLIGAHKNTQHSDLARATIPFTVNIHLIGDCFAIPILAYAILKNYGIAEPAFFNYLIFAFYFVLAKFSVAAVPGGGILVMLPILENYLGFNSEMMSLITALYILFDPVITSANVLGNGGFAMVIDKLQGAFLKLKKEECVNTLFDQG